MFGDMCFRVDKYRSLRLPDRVYDPAPAPAPTPTPSAPAIYPSSWVPPPRDEEDSSYFSDDLKDQLEGYSLESDASNASIDSPANQYLPARLLCAVIDATNGAGTGAGGRGDETGSTQDTIQVTEADWVVAREAIQGGGILPADATREQIACIRRMMEDERNELRELKEQLDERKHKADESSAR